jgi:hypothetical protein
MSFYIRLQKFNPNHDEKGRFASSGEGEVFVSPNVKTSLDFAGAIADLCSDRQKSLRMASSEVNHGMRIDARDTDAIGAWSDGAENSIMTVAHGASFEQLKVAAAMKAHLADQKAALVFKEAPAGKSVLFSFDAKGDLNTIHQGLLADGVAFHTLVPQSGGAKVYVCDLDGAATDAVEKGAKRYGAEVTFVRGHAAFVGTQKEDGSDREIRDDARGHYQRLIEGSRLQGAGGVWNRVHSAYGDTLTRKEPIKEAA